MHVDYVGRGIELTDELRDYTERQLESVMRFLDEPVELRLILEPEGHLKHAELHVHHRHGVLQAGEKSESVETAVHDAVAKLEKQARRARKKFMRMRRRSDRNKSWPVEVLEKGSLHQDGPIVIKSSEFQIKPMSLEEASMALEQATNDFIVFRDVEREKINVLYKRRDGNYGLINPES